MTASRPPPPAGFPKNQLVIRLLAQIEAARTLTRVHNPGNPQNKQVRYPRLCLELFTLQ